MEEINEENWFWCDICHHVSYDYQCECHATWCNCGGCEKCRHLHSKLDKMYADGLFPTEEFAKQNNIKKFGSKSTPEFRLCDKIFEVSQFGNVKEVHIWNGEGGAQID